MKKIAFAIAIIAVIGLLASPAFAQGMTQMKATVTKLQGEVVVTKAGASAAQPLAIGAVLGSGDKVETKDNGKAEIKMDNGNTLNLTPNSQIILSALTSDPATGEYQNLMESNFGTIRAHVATKVKGKSAFKIKTPTAISGARGTTFYLVITAGETRVFVTDGSVDFSNPTTGDTFVVVQDMASLSSAAGVSEPVELTGADRDAILAAYNASLASGDDNPSGDQPVPGGPSQNISPQTPTDNPPPGQQNEESAPAPEPPSQSEPG
jgi:hypothetical protein